MPLSRLRAAVAVLRLAPQVSRPLATAAAALAVADAVLPLVAAVLVGGIVGTIPAAVGGGLGSPAGHRLVVLLVSYGAIEALPVGEFRWRIATVLSSRIGVLLDRRVIDAMLEPAGIAHLEDAAVRDQATRAITFWNSSIVEGVLNVLITRATGFAYAVLLAARAPWVALALAVTWLPAGRWLWRRASATTDVLFERAHPLRRAEYVSGLAMEPGPAKEVRLFGMRGWLLDRFTREWTAAMSDVWRARRTTARAAGVYGLALFGAHALAFWAIGRDALAGGDLGGLAVAAQAVLGVAGLASLPYGHWEVEHGLRTVPANLALAEMTRAARFALPGDRAADGLPACEVRFEGVTFRYPSGNRDVLHGVDLTIAVGSSLAIVGENGAGKTTIVKLLCRFYDPSEGRVAVDGIDAATLDPDGWRRLIAALPQDFIRYPLTAAENIALTGSDREVLERVAERAGALGLMRSLPAGWETILTRAFVGGVDLSGGEWQRIALARALFAVEQGARILVLDEPTAHLDARAEADLYDRFLAMTTGLTTIVISHRFSTVRRADRIVVLDGGRIVEDGTHDELLAAGGRYARMFRLQAARFEKAPR